MADESERPATALIDIVAIVIGPVLIMMMVGSLVFFLIDVLYSGDYPERLLHTMFFFVIGAVLVARIGIQFGTTRAMMYVLGLGFATFLAMQAYVTYPTRLMQSVGPVISLGLMALIWWSANKLTWDCTHLDGEREAGGRGLMAATGFAESPPDNHQVEDEETSKKKKPAEGMVGWVQRWNDYRELQKKKPHTPGTWVIYFGLAAIPLFILGQSLIPADDSKRRFWTLLEMAMFVGSGLALLVTTSLLGLKKYLQDRGAKIPGAMTASWLGLGAALIISFLVFGALLPRPHSETPLVSLPKGTKSERKASKVAPDKGNEAGKGDGAKGNKTEAGDGKANAKGGQPGGKGEKGDSKSGSGSKDGKPQSGGGDKKGDQGSGKKGNDQSNDGNKQKGEEGNKQKGEDGNKSDQKGNRDSQEQKSNQQDSNDAQNPDDDKESNDGRSDGSSSLSKLTEVFEKIGAGLKWVVWIIVAVLVVIGVILFILKGLAPFTAWARGLLDWFKSLFGGKKKEGTATADEDEEIEQFRLPSFDTFSNPFQDGSSRSRPLSDLVSYTFRALESWASDHELARKGGETSREFADRLLNEFPKLESCGRLSALVNRMAYSKRPLPDDAADTLKSAWKEMESLAPVLR